MSKLAIPRPACFTTLDVGHMRLTDDELGVLDLTSVGYVVVSFEIGAPAPRKVGWNRTMTDGFRNHTRFVGGRVVTVTLRLDNINSGLSAQALYDRLAPYCAVDRRPLLSWSLAGSPDQVRALRVAGNGVPLPYSGPKAPSLVIQFDSDDAYMVSEDLHCQLIRPSSSVEEGRVYDLTFDRVYPPSLPTGGFIVNNAGNAPSDWVATILGPVPIDPRLSIGDIDIIFDQNGGLTLLDGQTVVIDTAAQTILFDGDPADSRYDRTNYLDYEWEQLRLPPGDSLVTFTATLLDPDSSATICWRDSWH